MKLVLPLASALALAAACTSPALDDGSRAPLRAIDANGDGGVQFAEIEAMRSRLFDRLDRDGDGVLSAAEVEATRERAEGRRGRGLGGRHAGFDGDGDGQITRAEFVAVPERLRRADVDGDGALARDELRALRR